MGRRGDGGVEIYRNIDSIGGATMSRIGLRILAAVLTLVIVAAPGLAGKRATVKKSFSVTAAPFPMSGSVQPGGCANGEEGIHKTTIPFRTPGKGTLSVELSNFVGDWDLHVAVNGSIIASSNGDHEAVTEQVSGLPFAKGAKVDIIACNWSGGPTADGTYTYVYKK
jgi:hypothetical protein